MTAYYNEIEPNAAAWLRTLIAEGHIAPGHVDERSIVDVRPADLDGYRQVHFFAGIGGWSLALRCAGWPDSDPVWTGSCPCQPFSLAGRRGGFKDDRHLWPEFRRLIEERRPAVAFGEQVASAADWLRLVRGDLEALEYAVGIMPIEAASAGADHLRDRFWFVADRDGERRNGQHPLLRGQEAGRLEDDISEASRCSDVGDRRGAGLEVRSIAKVQRGDVRDEGAPSPAAGHRSLPVADAASERLPRTPTWDGNAGLTGTARDDAPGLDVADARSDGAGCGSGGSDRTQGTVDRKHWRASGSSFAPRIDGEIEWVIGADGKARRVKSGVRLLAHGIPNRVGLLRGFGNAIDPRPAAAFIKAY